MSKFSFMPTNRKFFDLFESASQNLVEAGHVLVDIVDSWEDLETKVNTITDMEHKGDDITHEIVANLHRTFVTPIDREDISALAERMDDIIDFIQAAADAMLLYKITEPTHRARILARIILQGCKEIERVLPLLRQPKKLKEVSNCCIELNRLENQADSEYRAGLGELFSDYSDFAFIIQWREIYHYMESATDRCEDVANVLEGVALKYA